MSDSCTGLRRLFRRAQPQRAIRGRGIRVYIAHNFLVKDNVLLNVVVLLNVGGHTFTPFKGTRHTFICTALG
jgi:hypothetical protein